MAHSYRTLMHWNQWLSEQFLGEELLLAEHLLLSDLLHNHFGKQALLIGVPKQADLLTTNSLPKHSLVSPLSHQQMKTSYIEGDFHDLPILTASVDLVILPHTMEFIDHPRQLLAEACRVIKPEGLIVIAGFNPYSSWGMRKYLTKQSAIPWKGNFIPPVKVKRWLHLVDFELEQQKYLQYRPPINRPTLYHKLRFLENVGKICYPMLGGVYVLLARAKVVPLTPIRLKWKQQIKNVNIPPRISGHIAWYDDKELL